jgi:hypothetical protein
MKQLFILTLCISSFWMACLDEIQLKNQEFDSKALVIQGRLIRGQSGSGFVEASVQRLGEYGTNGVVSYITGAKVELLGPNNQVAQLRIPTGATTYTLAFHPTTSPFKVELNKSYQLRVTMPDGKRYISSSEILLPVPKMKKIWWETDTITFQNANGKVLTRDILRFKISTPIESNNSMEKENLRWQSNIAYKFTDDALRVCYSTEGLRNDKVVLFDPKTAALDQIDSMSIVETNLDFRFVEGSYVQVIQESLSKAALDYWNQIKLLAERTGNMFEAPAATVSSNIRSETNSQEDVFGFFYATSHDTIRVFIDSNQVSYKTPYCPQPPTPRIGPTICDNCILIGSTASYIRPYFWR